MALPSHPKNLEHELNAIKEVARNYDVDGIDLDWLRHPIHFKVTARRNNLVVWVQDATTREEAQALKKQFEAVAGTTAEIDEIHELCRARDIPFLIVIAPYRFQLLDPDGSRQPQDRLLAHAASRGIVGIDPLPGLAVAERRQEMFDDESHFSAAGHALVAERLLEPLRRALQP